MNRREALRKIIGGVAAVASIPVCGELVKKPMRYVLNKPEVLIACPGELILTAKKMAVMIKVPNELIKFAIPAERLLDPNFVLPGLELS